LHLATLRGIAPRLHWTARLGLTTAGLWLTLAGLSCAGPTPATLSARDVGDGIRDSIGADWIDRIAGTLAARRSCPDRGCAIAFGRRRVLIEASAAARPVAWEHGTTVEVENPDADW
jgi:hypothetical protein